VVEESRRLQSLKWTTAAETVEPTTGPTEGAIAAEAKAECQE